ncbi:MAG: hypothetical protein JWQ09_5764 [Segetibacter sp.]|nr:hypothetical protein [Segetibacter sp.]
METFYNNNGLSSTKPTNDTFWILEWNNQFSINSNDITGDLDFALIALSHKLQNKLFGSAQAFYNRLMTKTIWLSYAGIDAEIKISKVEFEKLVNNNKTDETNKFLYYYDVNNIIGSLQNLVQESKYLFCEFYKILNTNSFMLQSKPFENDSLMFASGQLVTNIFSAINHLFINLASQLDFITKICVEFENYPNNFSIYPKLKCKDILYGHANRIKGFTFENTVFEKSDKIQLILSLRNDIIHNSSFENIPKVYQQFKDGEMVEKYILIPDSTNGNFDTFKNRNRFFNNDIKLNEILPVLIFEFWNKLMATIKLVN